MDIDTCPVCRARTVAGFGTFEQIPYLHCLNCEAIFMHPDHHPGPAQERAVYDMHENHVDDPDYRHFLARLADPLMRRLSGASQGLDYGCGPGPALVAMLREAGHDMALYDPFYAPDPAALNRQYDFITCTEVAEHFHHPATQFDRLADLLRPGGILAVMTQFQTDDTDFATWQYRRDPTHVVFYREATMARIAEIHSWALDIPTGNVAIFTSP